MPYPNSSMPWERACLSFGTWRLYISDRLFEWFAAFLMLGDSIVLAIPDVVMTGAFGHLMRQGVPPVAFAMFFAVFGTVRICALAANGNVPTYGPRARAFCALLACPVWTLLGMAQAQDTWNNGRVSLALPLYFCLALAESATAIRATYDVGRV